VLSIERSHAAIIACYASAPTLDAFPAIGGSHACRVARDELLLIGPPMDGADTQQRATAHLASVEPSALVLDQSDGWAAFTLRGDEAPRLLAQLSDIPIPNARPAFLQGAVADGPAKVLLVDGAIHVVVPFTLRHHFAGRLRDASGGEVIARAAEVTFGNDPIAWQLPKLAVHPAPR
jgi:hypothetical protein